jgi:hypothetical protein
MALKDWLKSVSGKVGIVRFVSTTAPAAPRKVPTRTVTLKELLAETQKRDVETLSSLPGELSVSFDQVFDAAGIQAPAHGWTVCRMAEFLRDSRLKDMPRPALQQAIIAALAADQAHVQDVVKDAIARDEALDAFQIFVRAKMDTRAQARRKEMEQTRARILEMNGELARMEQEAAADDKRWQEWHTRKVSAEKEMSRTLAALIDDTVVTIDSDDGADKKSRVDKRL